jgi:hypothetical protein
MPGFYRFVAFAFWILGLITTVALLLGRMVGPLRGMLEDRLELRSLLWLAGVFFLGSIATVAVARLSKS